MWWNIRCSLRWIRSCQISSKSSTFLLPMQTEITHRIRSWSGFTSAGCERNVPKDQKPNIQTQYIITSPLHHVRPSGGSQDWPSNTRGCYWREKSHFTTQALCVSLCVSVCVYPAKHILLIKSFLWVCQCSKNISTWTYCVSTCFQTLCQHFPWFFFHNLLYSFLCEDTDNHF